MYDILAYKMLFSYFSFSILALDSCKEKVSKGAASTGGYIYIYIPLRVTLFSDEVLASTFPKALPIE